MNLIDHISSIPLFQGLSAQQYEELAKIVIVLDLRKGQQLFTEFSEGNGFYIVESGAVKLYKISSEGKEFVYHIFGPGESFGEVVIFTGKHFPANAEAIFPSSLLFIPRQPFVDLIKRNHSLSWNMLVALSWRLRSFSKSIEELTLKEVPGRLAAHFLYLNSIRSGKQNIELDIPRHQLASLLGTIPETLSRVFSKMTKEGLIKTDGSRIQILDLEGLQAIERGEKKLQ